MFKWPGTPSPRPPEHELADYAELVCWQQGSSSKTELIGILGRLDENDYSDGVPEEEVVPRVVEEAYSEIERRKEACRDGYPFVIGEHGNTLHSIEQVRSHKHIIYKYLLLATRLNMQNNRVHAEIDGSLLLEELAADVAREYFGNRAEKFVFGTAGETSDFEEKVNALCKQMEEGGGFVNHDMGPPNLRDGKLDVVAWKPFADRLPGKLIAFGQCKTGTNYRDTLTHLQPDSFCRKWLRSSPALTPVRMFFVAEAIYRLHWYSAASDAGLLFDRCRVVDFCDDISSEVLEKVTAWTEAAANDVALPN